MPAQPSVLAYCEEDPEGINEGIKQNMIKAQEEEILQRSEEEPSMQKGYLEGPDTPQELEAYDPRRQPYHHDFSISSIPEMSVTKNKPSSLYDSGISIRSSSPEPRESPVQQSTRKLLGKGQNKTSSKALSKVQSKKAVRSREKERKSRLPEAPMPPSREPSPVTVYIDPAAQIAEAPGHDAYQYGSDPHQHPMQYQQQYGHAPVGYRDDHRSLLQHPDGSRSPSVASTSASNSSPNPANDLPPKAGYDALVSKLSSTASTFSDQTPPVYRKFEALQNYKLLHLQDEIAEAEAHFDRLNAYLGLEARHNGQDCSRRVDDRTGDQLHWDRKRVQDFLFAKIEEYSESCPNAKPLDLHNLSICANCSTIDQALKSYQIVSQNLPSASPAQIASYKSHLSNLSPPLHPPERAFIDAPESDLVAICTTSSSPYSLSGAKGRLSPLGTALALLALIVAFKLVPQFLSRLVVGAVGGFALAGPEVIAIWASDGWEKGMRRVVMLAVVVVVLAIAVG